MKTKPVKKPVSLIVPAKPCKCKKGGVVGKKKC